LLKVLKAKEVIDNKALLLSRGVVLAVN
jgi:hypothetical protein